MNEQNEQDRVIRKWLQDEYNSIEIPDPSPAWDKVRIQLSGGAGIRNCVHEWRFLLPLLQLHS